LTLNEQGQPDPRFNAVHRIKRDLAEMLGLAKGLLADGQVTEEDAMLLMNWADDHPELVQAWPGNVLYQRLRKVFADGHAFEEEREDLKELLELLVVGQAGMRAAVQEAVRRIGGWPDLRLSSSPNATGWPVCR